MLTENDIQRAAALITERDKLNRIMAALNANKDAVCDLFCPCGPLRLTRGEMLALVSERRASVQERLNAVLRGNGN